MAARPLDSDGGGVPRVHRLALPEPRGAAWRRPLRHRLTVVAPDTAEAVRGAGGWMCDQALAGWDVFVLTTGAGADPRPLRILGARPTDPRAMLERPGRHAWPQVLAVCADLVERDERVRRLVLAALDQQRAQVRLWSVHWPQDAPPAPAAAQRVSSAARAFKARALAASRGPDAGAGIGAGIGEIAAELFMPGEALRTSH